MVEELAKDIEALDHEVWFDQALTGGKPWWDTILAKIRACDLFAFALSPDALDSQACTLEYTYAASLHKAILPILVADGVSTNLLPSSLSTIQFVDYRRQDRQAAFAIVKALQGLPEPEPLPDPLPDPPEVPISYLANLKARIETQDSLSFQEQTALVLRLKDGLHDMSDADDAEALLERLRDRRDLFAKVAEEIDAILSTQSALAKPPPIPEPSKKSWSAVLVSETDQGRAIQVQMGDVSRLVYVTYRNGVFRDEVVVTVDGKTVVKSPVTIEENLVSSKKSVEFNLSDDTGLHAATIHISKTRLTKKIIGCWLKVDGQMLYEQ